MSILKELVWEDLDNDPMLAPISLTESPLHQYVILKDGDKVRIRYSRNFDNFKYATGFATIADAKAWCWNHYNEKMQPYVMQDSTQRITSWFRAAKPKPTNRDICTQVGVHFEEVSEMQGAMGFVGYGENKDLSEIMKNLSNELVAEVGADCDHIELLDSLCDQIVTAVGVGYMMGFDMQSALNEVIRSNDSKMVNGKFIFDDNGKIDKPESYSEPNLTPFISTMQKVHKGD